MVQKNIIINLSKLEVEIGRLAIDGWRTYHIWLVNFNWLDGDCPGILSTTFLLLSIPKCSFFGGREED